MTERVRLQGRDDGVRFRRHSGNSVTHHRRFPIHYGEKDRLSDFWLKRILTTRMEFKKIILPFTGLGSDRQESRSFFLRLCMYDNRSQFKVQGSPGC